MKFITKCLSFIALLVGAYSQPSMIFNLNRHGVREPRDTSPHEGGALLLNSAYDRLYTKGQHLRQNYPNLLSSVYKPNEIRVNSSAWERTITTAHGILAGLYSTNDTRSIPVYSNPWEFDYTLYNYDKCPNYDRDWASFQTTSEFKNQISKYANLTSYLNTLLSPKTPITLSSIFSTWDLFWIQRNRPEVGTIAPFIDDYTYNTLTEAANYVESTRYSSRISKDYLGTTFLAAVKYRMDMFKTGNKIFRHKWISSSAHYATQLNVLASLGYIGIVSRTIPDYNSVITFELYNQTTNTQLYPSGWGIRIRYWDGIVSNSIPIALGSCIEGQECEIDYDTFWNLYPTKDLKSWCAGCSSTLWVCKGANPDNSTDSNTITTVVSSTSVQPIQIAIISIVSAILLIMILNSIAYSSDQRHKRLPTELHSI